MTELQVVRTRGDRVESRHRVHCAIVHAERGLVARSGDATLFAWWRSAAKPFQAMPLVEDGVADRLGLDAEQLALACASHSSEPRHLAVVDRFLSVVGASEAELACGPHPPLSSAVHRELLRTGQAPTPRWSNCSGKHTGMLALARHHCWSVEGYTAPGHPLQQRLLRSVAEWTQVDEAGIALGVDGCTTTCYGLSLEAMATAWARFGSSRHPAASRIREAMLAHPFLIAGTGRPCTAMMEAWPGEVIAKIGAEGVYGAALPQLGVGIALKIEDGDMRSSAIATVAVIRQLLAQAGRTEPEDLVGRLGDWIAPPILNTRGEPTGADAVAGGVVFLPAGARNG